MKKTIICCLLMVFVSHLVDAEKPSDIIVNRTENSISFEVDGNLSAPKEHLYQRKGHKVAGSLLNRFGIEKEEWSIIASSFGEDSLCFLGEDNFYQCVVQAYADHRPLVLSPDMIWIIISQGFSRYVNAHQEQLRSQIVDHEGKIDLVVQSEFDLLSENADWCGLIDSFIMDIRKHTKNGIADVIISDFSTTGVIERIASGVTLMETMDSYFNYESFWVACGIPSITLKGTPDDWRRVLTKTNELKKYGLGKWVKRLEPILKEFIQAAEGKPNRSFWQDIVKKKSVNALKGRLCNPTKPTKLDGWLLSFFPNEDGIISDYIRYTASMPSDIRHVDFKYKVLEPASGHVISETPMEIWAGIFGVYEDPKTYALTPCIGWMVRKAVHGEHVIYE